MKYLILLLVMFSTAAFASDAPSYMKDGTITVTLKDGKSYTFSSNEYMVVKRGSSELTLSPESEPQETKTQARPETTAISKNIVSVGVVRSTRGFDVAQDGSHVAVESKKELGISLQYQRNVKDNVFVGGRVDTNSGAEVNVGVGF